MTVASAPGFLLAYAGWGYDFYPEFGLFSALATGFGFSVLVWEPLETTRE